MKRYRSLKSIFHEHDQETAKREAQVWRANGFETQFSVGEEKLFYTVTPELMVLQE